MLEFASLFLGLIWGFQPIEMVVGDPAVVTVEFRLDGQRRAILEGAPWKTEIDFGPLAPHRLEVLAYGADGKRLARAEQWINVPRQAAEARLIVEKDAAGRKTHALLKWESVLGQPPTSIAVAFDGKPIASSDGERYPLPEADGSQLHFITAELRFPDGSTAHAEASFGGQFGDEVETELTAFPVRLLLEDAPTDALFSCISLADGTPLKVAQVERGPAEVIFVRDRGTEAVINRLRFQISTNKLPRMRGANNHAPRDRDMRRFDMLLEEEDRVRLVWPNLVKANHPHFEKAAFFESSPFYTAKDGGVLFFVSFLYPERQDGPQHLADALALAGLRAAAEGRRRAAVLFLGGLRPQDKSAQTQEAAQGFLRSLDVPLHVWSAANPGKSPKEWPPALSIDDIDAVRDAYEALKADLDSQRIVWIAGRYLATEIHLDSTRCPAFAPLFPRQGRPAAGGPAS